MTLAETMAVIAIVAILLAILVPVLGSARRRAYATDDLSRLRQLGQAAALYHDQTERWPRGVPDLDDARLVPKELAVSVLDHSINGITNEMAALWGQDRRPSSPNKVDYRLSFIGQRELRLNEDVVDKWIVSDTSGGWLVDLVESKRGRQPDYSDASGTYKRLQYDGSVVSRPFTSLDCSFKAQVQPCRMPLTMFVDPSDEMKQWIKSLG